MALPHQAQIRDPTFLNWVRAGLGLKYTKEGIQSFIDNEARVFHLSLLSQLGNPPPNCGQCTADNLLPHLQSACQRRTHCICSRGPNKNLRRFCPNNVCGTLFNAIVSDHRFNGPAWKNSYISQWVTDHWEVAKNFMPITGGYLNKATAADTDLSGLINIGINLLNITNRHNLTVSSFDGPDDFIKCRTARNEILHSHSQSLTDDELTGFLNDMKATLQCTAALLNDATAQQAVTKLTQLETSIFDITDENITEVRQMQKMAIENEGRKQVEAVTNEGETQIKNLQSEGSSQVEEVTNVAETQIKSLESEGSNQVETVTNVGETHIKKLQQEGSKQVGAMRDEGDNQIKKIQQAATVQTDARYQEEKEKLKQHLIQTYIVQLQPATLPEIDRLYVEPSMKLVTDGTEGKSVNIGEAFFQKGVQFTRIYISGDAGHGKTALCKMLVLAWCQEHSGKNISSYIPHDFLTVMKKFDFLFYITLRNIRKDWVISEIIKKQYFKGSDFLNLFIKNEFDKTSCLVILDGLDEWEPPLDYESPIHATHGLPDLSHIKWFTVLTTTRPWKLEVLRLGPLEMDRQVRLTGISTEASDRYIESMVDLLNQKKNVTKDCEVFKYQLMDQDLVHFLNIPILLKQLVTLWHHDEKEITGSSQVRLYSAMINHLLKDAWERNKRKPLPVGNTKESELPLCLEEKQYCRIHKNLLLPLTHLAFTLAFKGQIVFDHVEAQYQNLTEGDINSCLTAGLLCQEIYTSPLDDEKKKLSFLHKTFQDFLAAVFLVMNPESAELPQTCNTIRKILEMHSLFIFVSGMDSKVMTLLSQQIQNIMENDDKEKKHYKNEFPDWYELKHIQDLLCKCVGESEKSGQLLPYCHLDHVCITLDDHWDDTDRKNHLQHLITTNMSCIKYVHMSLSGDPPKDLFTCLSPVSESWPVQHLSLALYGGYERRPNGIEALLEKILCDNWSLSSLELELSVCEPCYRYLCSDRVTRLDMLGISNVDISSHEKYQMLMESVERATQLKILKLSHLNCRECKSSRHLDLSHWSQLHKLTLNDHNVTKVKINTTSIKDCEVYGTPIYFFPHAHDRTTIQTLELWHIRDPHSLDEVVTILPYLTQLSYLCLQYLEFGDRDVCLSPKAKHLKTVKLGCVIMTDRAMIQFLDSILTTNHKVDCEINGILNEAVETHINAIFVVTYRGRYWFRSGSFIQFYSQLTAL